MSNQTEAREAKLLLEDSVFQQAVQQYSKDLVESWEFSERAEKREAIWQQMTALKQVVNRLQGYVVSFEYEQSIQK